jgi:hypothetical protein
MLLNWLGGFSAGSLLFVGSCFSRKVTAQAQVLQIFTDSSRQQCSETSLNDHAAQQHSALPSRGTAT